MAKLFLKIIIIIPLLFSVLNMAACTSGEEDQSVLESEIENLDSEEELSDEFDDADGESGNLADIEDDELRDELDGEDEEDEFGEEDEGAFAEADSEDDFDKEFDEFGESDEQALAKELGNSNGEQKYPEAQNPQPTFPDEVIGQQQPIPVDPMEPIDPVVPGQVITSETKELDIGDSVTSQVPQDDLGKADPLIPEEEASNKNQTWLPVVKIKADPFYRNERLMNAVYLARPGDTIETVSDKIFGSNKVSILENDNPHLAKGMDPGDKVYYNSPNRQDDKSSLKVYYDDIGLEPQKYVTDKGDNIRRLGSKLLGFPDGWKEVWAINLNIDSKTILPAGTEVKYWTGDEQPAQVQAMIEEVPSETKTEPEPQDQEAAPLEEESAPPPAQVVAELPPEPPLPEATIGAVDDTVYEPEVIPDIEPLPEEDISATPAENIEAIGEAESGSSLITIGALALLLLGGAALVAIQIKNRKAQTAVTPPSLEYTQV